MVPFVSKNELSNGENVFDRLMNVFDEPFMQSFHMPDFHERSASSMSRSFYINNIDEAKATAEYKDGILSVHMPKSAEAKETSHTIAVGGAA